jgi:asparagine synthase (glutamine-hydrolysing)
LKLAHGEKKHLLRRAARPLVPASVLNHRKQGFASPMAAWLHGPLTGYVQSALAPAAIARSGVLQPETVAGHVRAHAERRALNDKQIFAMLMFERWWTRNGR